MMPSDERTILVVEDDLGLRALTEEVLGVAGYRILIAPEGAHALRMAEEYSGQIQLLLTDVNLPRMSGQEIARQLAALRPEMKVLFMSGYARSALIENGTLEPEANFMQKPWRPLTLCEKIHSLLATALTARRILVVDDEPGMRGWLVEILEEAGYQVFTAKDGLRAKAMAKQHALDFVITDISMPDEDGLGLICHIRKQHSDLKLIALSGGDPEILIDAKLLGASAAFTKPVTADTVLKCLRDLSQVRPRGATEGLGG